MNPIEITLSKTTIVEMVSEAAHEGWMEGKRAQGIETRQSEWGEELMVPYSDLSEKAKDLDRSTCKTVIELLDSFGLLVRAVGHRTFTLADVQTILNYGRLEGGPSDAGEIVGHLEDRGRISAPSSPRLDAARSTEPNTEETR